MGPVNGFHPYLIMLPSAAKTRDPLKPILIIWRKDSQATIVPLQLTEKIFIVISLGFCLESLLQDFFLSVMGPQTRIQDNSCIICCTLVIWIHPNLCCPVPKLQKVRFPQIQKVKTILWFSIKVTTLNSNFLMVYSSENISFLYLHFTW